MNVRSLLAAAAASLVCLVCDVASADEASPVEKLIVASQKTCTSVMPDASRACVVAITARRCQDGDGSACTDAAQYHLAWRIHDLEAGAVARQLLARGCTLDPQECVRGAFVAMGVFGDPELAHRFLTFGCFRSHDVCRTSALLYADGKRVPFSPTLAEWFFAQAR
jgi:hypothetical protein